MRKQTSSQPKRQGTISFYSKAQIDCPVCGKKFKREELHSGGGRLNAGELTDELRRLYLPSAKYGEVFPPVYNIIVCPQCFFAAFPADFRIIDKPTAEKLFALTEERMTAIKPLFSHLDFNALRTINEGAASYYLAVISYEHLDKKFSPTIKQAICTLRAAWLFSELHKKYPEENYNYVCDLFYKKATFLYRRALDLETTGKEIIAGLKSFGPDVDKNYGFDGVLYMAALLEYKYGSKTDQEVREKRLEYNKRSLAKMFGLGKASKTKPGPILEHARNLYDHLKVELHEDDN